MKKIALILALFAGFFFMGCEPVEEEEEPAQALTEFIVGGNWVYTEYDYSVPTHVSVVIFTGLFNADGSYELILSDGNQEMEFIGTYTIDDVENELTISNPFYVEGENDEFQTFAVEWQEGIDEMYWSEPNDPGSDVMKWVRNYDE